MKIRVRFAPSPTGYLHVGNARTALFNWLFARQKGGVFILRVEDTDIERSLQEYEEALISALKWLGLDWDEGPDIGGDYGPYRQSERLEIYDEYTKKLLEEGKAYYCFCSPEELEEERKRALAQGRMPKYSGKCRKITLDEALQRIKKGEKAAVRLRTPDVGEIKFNDMVRGEVVFSLEGIGDPVLVRSNGLPSYNYAVVIDDHLMRITHVIRGEDHVSNTPRQLLVYRAFNFKPPNFAHLSMVMGKDNTRLSKRHGATSIEQFREEGYLASALINYLALLGWAPPEGREVLTVEELIELFDLNRVSKSSAIFDYDKLNWINRQHIKRLTSREKAERAYPYLKKAGYLPDKMTSEHWKWLEKAIEGLITNVDRFPQLVKEFSIFFNFSPDDMGQEAKDIIKSEEGREVIKYFYEELSKLNNIDYETFIRIVESIKKKSGFKGKKLYHPLRVALTARASGLELNQFIPLVEEGSQLDFPLKIKNCKERVKEILKYL
ncbi:glutamate--tRNA ligase [Candidatus Aminicenantes bacterium AC-335-A11]|jgi:glutamyl-tRNA synthetase|nr:glutamate--tRNA ligase [SCandidatus Aminicenantes bacterium Aminicenantia_JdfR_composite]MCP2618569.1 glutamate--tRNA ligase [Candidatus Aminicenantes bacterium AC-335-A11]